MNSLDTRLQKPLIQPFFHHWQTPENKHWATFYRLENEYLIRFYDLADFHLSKIDFKISTYPVPNVSEQTIEHLYQNLVIPLALSAQSKLILHGSAVEIEDFSVAFLADSGGGKSTLAASFATNGFKLLSDDCIQLNKINSQYFIMPSHPSIRLWADSKEELILTTASCSLPLDYTSKSKFFADENIKFCKKESPLRNIYILGDGNTEEVTITPFTGHEIIIELEKHSFILDMEDRSILAKHFQQISTLAQSSIFFHLNYPCCYEILPKVLDKVAIHSSS